MRCGFVIQTLGSVVVLGTCLTAEAASYLLYRDPGSSWLWYLSIEVFGPFNVYGTPFQTALWSSLTPALIMMGLLLAIIAHALRVRLIVAAITNLSSMLAATLTYQVLVPTSGVRSASLYTSVGEVGPDVFLLLIICAISLIAAALSHVMFLRQSIEGVKIHEK